MIYLDTYARFPLTIVRGEGHRVQDEAGRWYLDGFAGIAVLALGHGHPRVRAAVHAQVDQLMHMSNLVTVPVQRDLASKLVEIYGGPVFLCNSGTEATEGVVKLVKKWFWRHGDPRQEIITAKGAFHGRSLLALAMTPKPAYREGYGDLVPNVVNLPAEEIPAAITEKTAAVVVEPIQGEGGCRPIPNLPELRAACDRAGALLVYDEVQCGLGRTGRILHEVAPDARTLAKALGGGLPLGAIVATERVQDAFKPGDHGTTFGGNPVACAAGLATLQTILEQDLPGNCARMGARLRAALEKTGAEVTGEGLMLAAHVDRPSGPIIAAMRDAGVLVCGAGDKGVRFLPAFTYGEAEIDELAASFAKAAAEA